MALQTKLHLSHPTITAKVIVTIVRACVIGLILIDPLFAAIANEALSLPQTILRHSEFRIGMFFHLMPISAEIGAHLISLIYKILVLTLLVSLA